ncbi:MAG: PAS domain S-box protein [Synechococcaceae cyanobacterium SM2_3_1]|nr:PAS domain S-box protein [Synechococcaceae cyanobacterium SM2_3_1]
MDPKTVKLPDLELLRQQIELVSNLQDPAMQISPEIASILRSACDYFQTGLQQLDVATESLCQSLAISQEEKIIGSVGATIDISEQEEFHSELRENLQRLNFHINNTPSAVIEWDPQFRVVQWSKRAEEIFGWQAEEVLGRTCGNWLIYHEDIEKANQLVSLSLEKHQQRYFLNNRNLTKDERIIYCEWHGSTLFTDNNEIVSILTFILDVTERKLAETALQESEIKFRQFAENIREVFYMLPADLSTHIYVSPAYEEIWGRPLEELYENPNAWMDAIHPDDRELVAQEMSTLVGKADYDGEFRIIRPDSQILWIHSRNFPVKDEHGQATRIVGIAEDITERKMAKIRLQESELRLKVLIENLPLSFWARDQDGKLVLQNRLNMLLYGHQLGTIYEDADLPSDRLERWKWCLQRAEKDEFLTVESQEIIQGETKTFLRVTMATPEVTAGIKYMGVALDITERKQAELALKAKQRNWINFLSITRTTLYRTY